MILRWLSFFLAILLLGCVSYLTDWKTIWALFCAHYLLLIPLILIRFLPVAVAAESTRQLLLGTLRRSYSFCFYLTWLRMALQVFLPSVASVTGEVLGVFVLRSRGMSTAAAISVMTISTFIITASIIVFSIGGFSWLIFTHNFFNPIIFSGICVGVILGLCLFGYYGFRSNLLQKIIEFFRN